MYVYIYIREARGGGISPEGMPRCTSSRDGLYAPPAHRPAPDREWRPRGKRIKLSLRRRTAAGTRIGTRGIGETNRIFEVSFQRYNISEKGEGVFFSLLIFLIFRLGSPERCNDMTWLSFDGLYRRVPGTCSCTYIYIYIVTVTYSRDVIWMIYHPPEHIFFLNQIQFFIFFFKHEQ